MSTIQASNVSDGTTTVGTSYVVNGSAKAWAGNVNDSAVASSSFNISSITDTGTGDNRLAFTSSMSADNYSVTSSAGPNGSAPRNITLYDSVAASYRLYCTIPSSGGTSVAPSCSSVFGDLA
jgi:hypothetical protein